MRNLKNGTRPANNFTGEETYTLITGGCGFVGVNLADRLLKTGKRVMVYDNLSRTGVQNNLDWLQERYPESLKVKVADVCDRDELADAIAYADTVFHFAAQVAVTSSLTDPFHDFEVNARGTLNILEAIRHSSHRPPIIFTSTNKVYGDLEDVHMKADAMRYSPETENIRLNGISEKRNLDFHSPYGCTKGIADQYVLDYARTFGIRSVVFRMSCIYGPHQYGNEDQGWVAHFLIRALKGLPITLYGDGKQVRDILFVDDLINAFLLAEKNMRNISGQAFNVGGGPNNTVSLLELIDLIENITGRKPEVNFESWRPSDQKYYVSDFRKLTDATGWQPAYGTAQGVKFLAEWLQQNLINEKHEQSSAIKKQKFQVQLEPVDK